MKDQKALKCIPIARLTFAVGLIFQQTLFSLGKPTRKVRANKTLRLQALVLLGFWAVINTAPQLAVNTLSGRVFEGNGAGAQSRNVAIGNRAD
jgi:hypothetical protein